MCMFKISDIQFLIYVRQIWKESYLKVVVKGWREACMPLYTKCYLCFNFNLYIIKYPNKTLLHFNASTCMVPYLHQFSAVMKKINFFGSIWKTALYLIHIYFLAFLLKKYITQLHLLKLFVTNLVSIFSTKTQKKAHYLMFN